MSEWNGKRESERERWWGGGGGRRLERERIFFLRVEKIRVCMACNKLVNKVWTEKWSDGIKRYIII